MTALHGARGLVQVQAVSYEDKASRVPPLSMDPGAVVSSWFKRVIGLEIIALGKTGTSSAAFVPYMKLFAS